MNSTPNNLPLTHWGETVQKRLDKLGKDRAWICRMININGWHYQIEDLDMLMTGQSKSRPKEENVNRILAEEEERQRLKKVVGIKR